MTLETITLGGIEYVLIPKDLFEKTLGISSELPTDEEEETKVEAIPEEKIKIVEAMPDIKKAQPKAYGYQERLKKHSLVPEDVMVVRTNFQEMPEAPEIARNDFKDKNHPGLIKAKYGFYGPGAERDLG